jgi:transposase
MPGIGIVMLNLDGKRVYLACGVTDMRKAINGLTAMVEQSFKLDLFDEAVFVFCNRNRNRLKIILWDGDGFWLLFKRLEKGRFRWPTKEGESTMTLTAEELQILIGGAKVELKLKRNEVNERRAS